MGILVQEKKLKRNKLKKLKNYLQ